MNKLPSYPHNVEDWGIIQLGEHPEIQGEKLIKVCVAESLGYTSTEEEAIQMIEILQNW